MLYVNIKIHLITGSLLNCIDENQISVAVFDRIRVQCLCILPSYGTYPLYSRLRNVSIFRYNSASDTDILLFCNTLFYLKILEQKGFQCPDNWTDNSNYSSECYFWRRYHQHHSTSKKRCFITGVINIKWSLNKLYKLTKM